jgi:signal transduction histidine kinase
MSRVKQQAFIAVMSAASLFSCGNRMSTGQIQQKLADGKERSVYEAYRAIAEYQLASGDYRHALETTRRMERELKGVQNSGLQWGLNLLRTEILRKLGHSDEAYDTLRAMVDRRSSASVSRLRRQLSEMDSQYQIDEMRIQEQKSHFWWAVSVSLIIIIGLAVFAYFRQCTARLLARKNQELADALARAQESDRMKTAFVQHISHEIRTPLNIITGFAQVIASPDFEVSTEDRNRMLADISRNTNEITTFVNELLELSESESQHPYEQNDDVDISALCQQVVGETDNSAHLQITVESHLPEGYTLRSNADALHKILTRLMSNAVKFTSQGSVTLRLTPLGDRLRIEVEDTGIGIAPEHQEKVFERFYKVDTFKQGIGLGLTVARRSAELLGGTLAIDPAYTAGARFVLTV